MIRLSSAWVFGTSSLRMGNGYHISPRLDRNRPMCFTKLMGRTPDGAFMRPQSLLWLALVAPVLTLFIAHVGSSPPSLNNAGACLLVTWICTVVAGVAVHGVVYLSAPWLVARGRVATVAGLGLLTASTA